MSTHYVVLSTEQAEYVAACLTRERCGDVETHATTAGEVAVYLTAPQPTCVLRSAWSR